MALHLRLRAFDNKLCPIGRQAVGVVGSLSGLRICNCSLLSGMSMGHMGRVFLETNCPSFLQLDDTVVKLESCRATSAKSVNCGDCMKADTATDIYLHISWSQVCVLSQFVYQRYCM